MSPASPADQWAKIRLDASSSNRSDEERCFIGTPSDPTRPVAPALVAVLEESQRLGFLGGRPIIEVVDHARRFVRALDAFAPPSGADVVSVLDLGAGGGVPGLVISHDIPSAVITLLDRRRTRTDFLARMVRRLEWEGRVSVLTMDAERAGATEGVFDAVVARGFGPPVVTLSVAADWVRPGGLVVISEPPIGDRWDPADVSAVGVDRVDGPAGVACFIRR